MILHGTDGVSQGFCCWWLFRAFPFCGTGPAHSRRQFRKGLQQGWAAPPARERSEDKAGHYRCTAGLKMQSEGLWGNRKCRAGCGLFNIREAGWYLPACILSERSVHNLRVSLHVFFGPGTSGWCSLTRGKQRNHLSAVSS